MHEYYEFVVVQLLYIFICYEKLTTSPGTEYMYVCMFMHAHALRVLVR